MLLYPLDTVKTRIQAEQTERKEEVVRGGLFRRSISSREPLLLSKKKKPFLFQFYESIHRDGVLQLFNGVKPKFYHALTSSFVYFFAFSGLKRKVEERNPNQKISIGMSLIVATTAAAMNVLLTEPLDTLSTRAQVGSCPTKRGERGGERDGMSVHESGDFSNVGQSFNQRDSKEEERKKKFHASDSEVSDSENESDSESESDDDDDESIASTPGQSSATKGGKRGNASFVTSSSSFRDVVNRKLERAQRISSKTIRKLRMKLPSKKMLEKKARMYKRRVRKEYRRSVEILTTTVPNLYAGVGASLLLTVNPTIQYTMYEQLRQRALKGLSVGRRKPVRELPVFEAIVIAALSKAAATVATYPLIRAKVLQKAATNPNEQHSQQKNRRNASSKPTDFATLSLLQIMADLKKREGYAGWYQGLNAQLTKTVVASAIGLSIKEKSFRASQLLVAAFSKHD